MSPRSISSPRGAFWIVSGAAAIALLPVSARAITISEIHYDPPGSAVGLEFIEVANESPTVADVSGWSFTEGVDFTFPKGTFISGRGYLVVCGNQSAFAATYPGVTVAGQWNGKLDSTGETIALSNEGGAEILRIKYKDRGKWTSLPAGTGHTLSLARIFLDPSEPESWTASALPGGTPGSANFPNGGFQETEILPLGTAWNYLKGTAEFSNPPEAWRQASFAPSGWSSGNTAPPNRGFGYGDGDDETPLDDMINVYWSVAIRKTFTMTPASINAIESLVLGVNYDDGFVAYLNGTEVIRSIMPGAPGTPVPFDTPALGQGHEAGIEEQFEIPKSLLVAGTNCLAIQGHNVQLSSSDLSLAPRLLSRKALATAASPSGIVFNEMLGRTAGARWVELFNASAQPVSLSGYFLSDSADNLAKYALPAGSDLPAGGYLVITEAQSGLNLAAPEVRLFLTMPDRSFTVAAQIFENVPTDGIAASRAGYSDARFPDGVGAFAYSSTPTPGAANAISVSRDVVINEILYNPPPGNTGGEFIEIFNRGAAAVDLSAWSIKKGIAYTFPQGTVLAAGGYLVVAQDPAGLMSANGIAGVLGPWSGTLANSGEAIELVDAIGNTVNEVRYYDGGRWSPWADGGGSSLELIDPRQDNSFATAWGPSDESPKSQWTKFTYSGAYNPESESELHVMLLDAGTVLLDELSLKRSGSATEYIPNGGFESTTSPWLIQGTHVGSRRITTDAHAGVACLEVNASGGGDNGMNKLDTDTSPAMTSGTYTVSFWARWIRGGDKLLTRADSTTGASLQHVNALALPPNIGTPGAENSARLALKAQSPGGNLGPVIGDVVQKPVVPGPSVPVTVTCRAKDADGVSSLAVFYKTGGVASGAFASAPAFDDGAHGDGGASDGVFTAVIPGQAQGSRVIFYLEGTDGAGAQRRYPVEAPSKTLLYSVESASPSPLFTVRLNLDDDNQNILDSRSTPEAGMLHSDELVDASFVFNDEDVYYNVGVRYHGSPWNRPPDPKMFRVRFNEDHPFVHGLKSVNLSRYGSSQNEGTAYFCIQSASAPHSPAPSGDYYYARVFHNTGFHAQMAIVETVDGHYTQKWFPGDGDGYIYKIPGRRYLDDNGNMSTVDWTTFSFRGGAVGSQDEFERYRWYFIPNSNQTENRWTDLNRLCTIMDPAKTSTTLFDGAVESILDVEQFLRVEAARVLQDDWDTIGIGNGQNAYVYFAPNEGRFKLFPWDMDHTFGNTAAKLYPEGSETGITRLVQRPKYRRMYLRILQQMLGSSWDPAYIGSYLSQTQSVTGMDGSGILQFITTRRPSVVAQAPSTLTFRLTNIGTTVIPANWPGVYYTSKSSERIRGTAPLDIDTLILLRDGDNLDAPVTWGPTNWTIDFSIAGATNEFELLAFSAGGDLLGSIAFTVVSTVGWQPPAVTQVEPVFGPAAGGTQVHITGTQFRGGARVFFGAVEATQVTVVSPTEITATSPPSTAGLVSVKVQNADAQSSEKANAFEYLAPLAFLRGDANTDGTIDIIDPLRILFYLYRDGNLLQCLDAADFDNNGVLDITDAVATLNYLFRGGTQPAAPFPVPGSDPASPPGSLGCEKGL